MPFPDPPVPAECDLRGLVFMPLDAQRLRDSDLALFSTGDEFKAAVLLWCASWHRVPAGSLPDDERVLCRFSGLDPKSWRKAREGAMRGWVKCSDGLLYHDVVAEKAREAWEGRQRYQQKREADRERLKEWRERRQRDSETAHGNGDETPVETPDETRFETPKTVEVSGEEVRDANASIVGTPPKSPVRKRAYPPEFEAAWKAYPHVEGRSSKPDALAEWRRLPADERGGLLGMVERFRPNVAKACGDKGAPDMARWIKHGKHLAWAGEAEPASAPAAWPGPPEILAAVEAAMPGRGGGYLAKYCTWQDVPSRALVCSQSLICDFIRKEAGHALEALDVRVLVSGRAA